MKKGQHSTWILLVVVGLIAGYTAYEFRQAQREGKLEEGEVPAFTIKNPEVTEVKIVRGSETILVHKNGQDWTIQQPIQDDGDLGGMESFMYSLLGQRLRHASTGGQSSTPDWKTYGLEDGMRIEVATKNDRQTVVVSSKNAFDGKFYIRQGDHLMLGDPSWAQLKERTVSSFRSRNLWREPEDVKIETASVQADVGAFTLRHQDGKWRLEPDPGFVIDADLVGQWLDRVLRLVASDFTKEQASQEDLKTYLLLKPSYTLDLKFKRADGQDGTWKLTLGQDRAGEIFMMSSARPNIYQIQTSALNGIRVPAQYFRNTQSAFDFPLEQVREIEIASKEFSHKFKKVDANWVLVSDDKTLELNQERLIKWMQSLRELRAVELLSTPGSGLGQPQVTLRDADGAVIFSLSWGSDYKSKLLYAANTELMYTKTNLEKSVMAVEKAKLERLLDRSLVSKKAVEKK